ncbi:aldo/keto reductase [Promicromonospora sp. NFX87]|uniref:aldo/keto reductase n=1 Tax=Promicromonospora sp. NFX87 TaxID=3402691 RepID=UPI003AFB4403
MPLVGVGTWRLNGDQLSRVLDQAIVIGYRSIDTAPYYGNEATVGSAVRRSAERREDLFVTTKIRGTDQGRESAVRGLEQSLHRLGLDYVDLLLIHWPLPMWDLYVSTWEAMIDLRSSGLVRVIGVSNFEPEHVDRVIHETGVVPAVNQIQHNAAIPNAAMRAHNRRRRIHTQAWEPLGNRNGLLDHPVVRDAAAAIGRTPAQVLLRWNLERGVSVMPKASCLSHLEENLALYSWSLPPDLLCALDGLSGDDANRVDPVTNLVE